MPAVALGDAPGSVGTTGAVVTEGALCAGCIVTTGVLPAVGTAGAFVGIDTFPRAVQVQPVKTSSAARSGIKKNRYMIRISFRFFSVSVPEDVRVIRLQDGKNRVILRV